MIKLSSKATAPAEKNKEPKKDSDNAFGLSEKDELNELKSSSEALQNFSSMLRAAYDLGANDIHITALRSTQECYALFSVEKALRLNDVHQFKSYDHCYSMLAAMYDTLGAQSGQTDFDGFSDQETSFTHSITVRGEAVVLTCRVAKTVPERVDDVHAVIRLINLSEPLPLDDLHLPASKKQVLLSSIGLKQGAVITSGPMGSGKTVTMTSLLNNVSDQLQVQTIEDPIEVRFSKKNIVQNQLKANAHKQLSMVLRQNVAVLYLGEIRDVETAEAFIKHVLSGHLGCATTHANNAIGIVQRLIKLGVKTVELSSFGVLALLMAQRLEKVLCQHCRIQVHEKDLHVLNDFELTRAWRAFDLSDDDEIYMINHKGCEHCFMGTKGRQIIMEQIQIGKKDRQFIASGDMDGWEHYLQEMGFDSLGQQTIAFVKKGVLCPVQSYQSIAPE